MNAQIELLTSMAVFHLQTAFFHPTAAGSVEAFEKYLETQNKVLLLQLEQMMSQSQASLPAGPGARV